MRAGHAAFLVWAAYLVAAAALMFARGFLLSRDADAERARCQPYAQIPCGPREAGGGGGGSGGGAGADRLCTSADRLASLLHDVNASSRVCPPRRARVVLLVIDALGYDFAAESADPGAPPYRNRLKSVARLLRAHPDRTRLYEFLADPPTTTLQRLKGLTTGSLPTFVDAGSNFATPEIDEDNFVDQVPIDVTTYSFIIILTLL